MVDIMAKRSMHSFCLCWFMCCVFKSASAAGTGGVSLQDEVECQRRKSKGKGKGNRSVPCELFTNDNTKTPTPVPTSPHRSPPRNTNTAAPSSSSGNQSSKSDPPVFKDDGFIGCESVHGDFGTLEGDGHIVDFHYSVLLDNNMSVDEFTSTILPELENSMNSMLVAVLFACDDLPLPIQDKQRRQMIATLQGLSVRPNDSVLTDYVCPDTTETCFGVLGEKTLYTVNSNNGERRRRDLQNSDPELKLVVREALRKAMNAGQFDDNPPIIKVTYVDYENGNETNEIDPAENDNDDIQENDDGNEPNETDPVENDNDNIQENDDGNEGNQIGEDDSPTDIDNNKDDSSKDVDDESGNDVDNISRSVDSGNASDGVNQSIVAPLVVVAGLALIALTAVLVRRRRKTRENAQGREYSQPNLSPDNSEDDE